MRKTILLMLLAVVSSSAAAAWVEFGRYDDGNTIGYTDPATIRKEGSMAKMWALLDFKTVQVSAKGKPFMSARMQSEYDCKEPKMRVLYSAIHSENMAAGRAVASTSEPGKWRPVLPDSTLEDLRKFACGQR